MLKKILPVLLVLLLLAGCGLAPEPTSPTRPTVAAGTSDILTVRFLDVGQADCALLECGGEYILIDGGNVDDGSKVVSFLSHTGVEELEAVFCTHAHGDHVGGLAAVLAVFPTKAVYAPTRTYSSNAFDNFLYYTDQQGLTVTIPEVGDTVSFGGATAEILGPLTTDYEDINNTSLVMRITLGDTRFLFTGDMEALAEGDLIDAGTDLKADVLKVGHHGSYSSTSYRFLYHVMPSYAVISVGADNSYGHPHEAPVSRLSDAGAVIYRTDQLGTVTAISDGTDIRFTWEKNAQSPDAPEADTACYIGNSRSKVFHMDDCPNLPHKDGQIRFDSYEEAIEAGYRPCGNCLG